MKEELEEVVPLRNQKLDPKDFCSWWPTELHPLIKGEHPICVARIQRFDEVEDSCCSDTHPFATNLLVNHATGEICFVCNHCKPAYTLVLELASKSKGHVESFHYMPEAGSTCKCYSPSGQLVRTALVPSRKSKSFCIRCEKAVDPSTSVMTSSKWFRLPLERRF